MNKPIYYKGVAPYLLGRCGLAGADGPDWLIGDDHLGGVEDVLDRQQLLGHLGQDRLSKKKNLGKSLAMKEYVLKAKAELGTKPCACP